MDDSWQERTEHCHAASPIVNDPEEKVTKKCCKFRIEFETSRPVHQPYDRALKPFDGPGTEDPVHLRGNQSGIFDDVGPKRDANDHVVCNQPETVIESNVLWMAVCDALPRPLALAKCEVLDRPIAKLLQTNIYLLCSSRDVFQRRVSWEQAPVQDKEEDLTRYSMGNKTKYEELRDDWPDPNGRDMPKSEHNEIP